jgi:hypothetical protein
MLQLSAATGVIMHLCRMLHEQAHYGNVQQVESGRKLLHQGNILLVHVQSTDVPAPGKANTPMYTFILHLSGHRQSSVPQLRSMIHGQEHAHHSVCWSNIPASTPAGAAPTSGGAT